MGYKNRPLIITYNNIITYYNHKVKRLFIFVKLHKKSFYLTSDKKDFLLIFTYGQFPIFWRS